MKILATSDHKPISYKDIYDAIHDNPIIRRKKDKIAKIASLVYTHGYKDELSPTVEDAVYIALEIYEQMTGYYWDPSPEEFRSLKYMTEKYD